MSKYLEDNSEYMSKMVEECKSLFGNVNSAVKSFASTQHNNVELLRSQSITFNTLYSICRSKLADISSTKKHRESACFLDIQAGNIATVGKATVDGVKTQASLYVAPERELRDMIEAKMDICLETLRTIRLLLSTYVPVKEEV